MNQQTADLYNSKLDQTDIKFEFFSALAKSGVEINFSAIFPKFRGTNGEIS
uniref:Uncharacterized protein n=1 Tax=Arion vulgaris TaxID=1028688 RepID=A0A0B7A1G7_9EUPU